MTPCGEYSANAHVNRAASILLVICFVGLATKSLSHLHDLDHRREDEARAAAAAASEVPAAEESHHQHHHHNESDCDLHAQLQLPIIATGWVPLLVYFGLFLAFLTLLSASLVDQRQPVRIHCRGPPAC